MKRSIINEIRNKIIYSIIKRNYKNGNFFIVDDKISIVTKEGIANTSKTIAFEEFINKYVCIDIRDFNNKIPQKYNKEDDDFKDNEIIESMSRVRNSLIRLGDKKLNKYFDLFLKFLIMILGVICGHIF